MTGDVAAGSGESGRRHGGGRTTLAVAGGLGSRRTMGRRRGDGGSRPPPRFARIRQRWLRQAGSVTVGQ